MNLENQIAQENRFMLENPREFLEMKERRLKQLLNQLEQKRAKEVAEMMKEKTSSQR